MTEKRSDPPASFFRDRVTSRHIYAVKSQPGIRAKLNQNENPYDWPQEIKDEIVGRLAEVEWNRYATDYSHPLREVLAKSIGLDPENVLLGNGSNELIYSTTMSFAEPGKKIVLLEPMFAVHESGVNLHGGEIVGVRPDENFRFDPKAVIAAAKEHQAPLTIITNPNSPTGVEMPRQDLVEIIDQVPGMVLVDEAYAEFLADESVLSLVTSRPNLMVLRTFSKAIGMAGLRLGYLAAAKETITELLKARLPFVVNRLTETVAMTVLQHGDIIEENVARVALERERIYEALASMEGVRAVPSRANFIIFHTPRPVEELLSALVERGVLIRNVGGYPQMANFARVSVGLPEENDLFLDAMEQILAGGV